MRWLPPCDSPKGFELTFTRETAPKDSGLQALTVTNVTAQVARPFPDNAHTTRQSRHTWEGLLDYLVEFNQSIILSTVDPSGTTDTQRNQG